MNVKLCEIGSFEEAAFLETKGVPLVSVEPADASKRFLKFNFPADQSARISLLLEEYKNGAVVCAQEFAGKLREHRRRIALLRQGSDP